MLVAEEDRRGGCIFWRWMELQAVVSHGTWVLGTAGVSGRAATERS